MTNQPELSVEQVRQVAALCHIALTDDEAEQLRAEMASLLDEVSVLQRIDTSGVEPTGHAVEGVHTVMRDDVPRPRWSARTCSPTPPGARAPSSACRPSWTSPDR